MQVRNVWLQQGRFSLLEDISFEAQAGDRILLLGPSGSGKTLLFRLLNGLLSPSQGEILFQERAIADIPPLQLRRQIAWVAAPPRLLGMTVQEAIVYPLRLQSLSPETIQARLTASLDLLEIPTTWLDKTELDLTPPEQSRVVLARAWAMQPLLLMLEWSSLAHQQPGSSTEKTAGQIEAESSPDQREIIGRVLSQLQRQGGTAIAASNVMPASWEPACSGDWTQVLYLGRSPTKPPTTSATSTTSADAPQGSTLKTYAPSENNPSLWAQLQQQLEQEVALGQTLQDWDDDWQEDDSF